MSTYDTPPEQLIETKSVHDTNPSAGEHIVEEGENSTKAKTVTKAVFSETFSNRNKHLKHLACFFTLIKLAKKYCLINL